jgi:hypothetical protein
MTEGTVAFQTSEKDRARLIRAVRNLAGQASMKFGSDFSADELAALRELYGRLEAL